MGALLPGNWLALTLAVALAIISVAVPLGIKAAVARGTETFPKSDGIHTYFLTYHRNPIKVDIVGAVLALTVGILALLWAPIYGILLCALGFIALLTAIIRTV